MIAVLPSLLLGLAVALLLSGRTATARLRALSPVKPVAAAREGLSPVLLRSVSLLAGAVLALLLRGVSGLVVGVVVALVLPGLLGRLNASEDDGPLLAAQLPLGLDLLGACLAGGSTLHDAVGAVAAAVPGPLGDRMLRVHAALAVGSAPAEAFRALGDDRGPAGSAARALSRSLAGGAPVALVISRLAADTRRAAAAEATARARKAGVRAAAPLGACFLPAFLLISVVPTVIGMSGALFDVL